ncbi:DNA polymerase III subunit beta [Botrimarina sp.]|uniref:DNA polymerase III subunit beta n=1 Tax=Botrimarina sp. TaxID=2795802 RepID=UPI0032EF8937
MAVITTPAAVYANTYAPVAPPAESPAPDALRVTCDGKALLAALRVVCAVTPKRLPPKSKRPALKFCRLTLSGYSEAELFATDGVTSLRVRVDGADVATAGEVLLNPHELARFCRDSKSATVTIEAARGRLLVRGEHCRAEFDVTESPDALPLPDTGAEFGHVVVANDTLRDAIEATHRATDDETSRYALGGVWIGHHRDRDGSDSVSFVATDGRRLHWSRTNGAAASELWPRADSTILPVKAAKLLGKLLKLPGAGSRVSIARTAKYVKATAAGFELSTLALEGRFPSWEDVIPARTAPPVFTVEAGPFRAAVKQAALTCGDRPWVDFAFVAEFVENRAPYLACELTRETEGGESSARVYVAGADNWPSDSPRLAVRLNPGFVADALAPCAPGELVTFEVIDGDSAVIIRAASLTAVIMPLARDR